MATDNRVFVPPDASALPTFRVEGLDMTGVGWSLRVACQVEVDGRPFAYCRLAVGHGGAHQSEPVDRHPRRGTDARRLLTRTVGPDEQTVTACSPGSSIDPAPPVAPSPVRPGPGASPSRRPPGPVRRRRSPLT
jgi:hypothetical protein